MTGIAAANRSHLKFFPDMDAYGVYYDLLVELSRIAVANFAERCQSLLVPGSWLFFAQSTVMLPPTGIRPTGPGAVAECV